MGRFPASTTCLASSQPRAKRRITCRRGKEHPFLRRQRSGSLLRALPRVPRAQRKSHKKKLENQETPKKADLFVIAAVYGISRQSLAGVQQLRWLNPSRLIPGSHTPSLMGTKLVSSFHQPINSLNLLVLSLANTLPVSVFIIRSNLNNLSRKWLMQPPMFLPWAPP